MYKSTLQAQSQTECDDAPPASDLLQRQSGQRRAGPQCIHTKTLAVSSSTLCAFRCLVDPTAAPTHKAPYNQRSKETISVPSSDDPLHLYYYLILFVTNWRKSIRNSSRKSKSFIFESKRLFVICFFCVYYKPRSDTCYTRIFSAEGCDSILHIDVVQRRSAISHARNCGVLGVQ